MKCACGAEIIPTTEKTRSMLRINDSLLCTKLLREMVARR
jgi:hypothetical protein